MILLLLTLLDGSAVKLQTTNFELKVLSKYGTMSVPAGDIIDVAVGVHYLEEAEYKNHFNLLSAAD